MSVRKSCGYTKKVVDILAELWIYSKSCGYTVTKLQMEVVVILK